MVPTVASRCREIRERAGLNSNLLQVIKQRAQKLFTEPRSDSAGKFKFAFLIYADQQGSQMFPFTGRLGISAD